jgi:hypothetical protein
MSASIPPSANEGHVPFFTTYLDVVSKDGVGGKAPQRIVFRIFIRQDNDLLSSVRLQISTDSELDFLYEATYDAGAFEAMKARQRLELDFADFPNVVRQQIAAVIREADLGCAERRLKAVLLPEDPAAGDDDEYDDPDGADARGARLFVVFQRLDFCRVEILKFRLAPVPAERTAQISQMRFDELAARLRALETEYKDVYKRVQRTAPAALAGFDPDIAARE